MAVSSLENIAAMTVAIDLCNGTELKREILHVCSLDIECCDSHHKKMWDEKVSKKAVAILARLGIPKQHREKLLGIVIAIGAQMLTWAEYHESLLHSSRSFSMAILNRSCFTKYGIMDDQKIAEGLLKDTSLTLMQKYKLACMYCCADDIYSLFIQMSIEEKQYFHTVDNAQQPKLVTFWSYFFNHDINRLRGNKTIQQFRLEMALQDSSKAAVSFCLIRAVLNKRGLLEEAAANIVLKILLDRCTNGGYAVFKRRVSSLPSLYMQRWIPSHYYMEVLCYLLSYMSEEELREFFVKDIEQANNLLSIGNLILRFFLDWPYQVHFMKFVRLMWNLLSEKSYADLLFRICSKIEAKDTGALKFGENKCYDYRVLFRVFWSESPDHYKRYVFRKSMTSENGHVIVNEGLRFLVKLFKLDLNFADKINIDLIFRSATDEEKKNIVFSEEGKIICTELIIKDKWEMLSEFLLYAFLCKNKECKLKREQRWVKHPQQIYMGFVPNSDKQDKSETNIECISCLNTEEDIRYLKNEMILSDLGVNTLVKYFLLEDKWILADDIIRWSLLSDEQIKQLKKNIAYKKGGEICKNLISGFDVKYVVDDMCNVQGKIVEFKGCKWQHVEIFLKWCFSNEDEINSFKRALLTMEGGDGGKMGFLIEIHYLLLAAFKWEDANYFLKWLNVPFCIERQLRRGTVLCHSSIEWLSDLVYESTSETYPLNYAGDEWEDVKIFLKLCLLDADITLEFVNKFDNAFGFQSYEEYGFDVPEYKKDALKKFYLLIQDVVFQNGVNGEILLHDFIQKAETTKKRKKNSDELSQDKRIYQTSVENRGDEA